MAKKLNIGAVARWTGTPILTFVNGTPESIDLAQWVYNPRGFNLTYTVASGSLGEVTLVGSVVSFDGSGPQSSTPVSFNISDGSRTKESPQTSVVILNQPVVEPAVPVNVQADGLTQDTIRVIWTPGVGGPTPTSFPVYRSTTQNGTYTQIAEPVSSPYDDSGFPASTTRWYKVSAKADGIESAQSTADAGTTLAEPSQGWPTQTPSYTPIVRNLAGPGVNTPAGFGRNGTGTPTIYYVNSVADTDTGNTTTKRGTLRWCIGQHNAGSTPGVILFETSGTINSSTGFSVNRSYLTLAGQSAPAPGIQIFGRNSSNGGPLFRVRECGNVLIQHLTFRYDCVLAAHMGDTVDAVEFSTQGRTGSIVFDHVTAMWGGDEILSTNGGVENVTINQCVIAEPVNNLNSSSEDHRFGSLVPEGPGGIPRNFLFRGNLFARAIGRMPYTRSEYVAIVNDVVYHYTLGDVVGFSAYGVPGSDTFSTIQGNDFIYGPGNSTSKPCGAVSGTSGYTMDSGSQMYFGNNRLNGSIPSTQFTTLLRLAGGNAPSSVVSPPYWPAGLVAVTLADNNVRDLVHATVGARPGERIAAVAGQYDPVTAEVCDGMRNQTGVMKVRSPSPNFSLPSYAVNARPLTPPADPHVVGGGEVYTNLERWLHDYEDLVL